MLSDFKTGAFGKDYGLIMTSGGFDGLHSRCVVVVDTNGTVLYTEQVPEIAQEPNYKAALELGYTKSIGEIYETAGIQFDFSSTYVKELIDFVWSELAKLK